MVNKHNLTFKMLANLSLFSLLATSGLFGFQSPANALLLPAVQVIGQLTQAGQPNFNQWQDHGTPISDFAFDEAQNMIIDKNNARLFISDTQNSRVMVFLLDPQSYKPLSHTASYVLGQADFEGHLANRGGQTNADTLDYPRQLAFDQDRNLLYVADSGNNRVLIYDTAIIDNGEQAVAVLGPKEFTDASFVYDTSEQTTHLILPQGVTLNTKGSILYVADTGKNRVVVFDVSTIDNGEPAIAVLGQNNLLAHLENQGGPISARTLYMPINITYDFDRDILFVVDFGNHRALGYDMSNITNGEEATYVLGQQDFVSGNLQPTSKTTIGEPLGIVYDNTNHLLYISDANPPTDRVMIFDASNIHNGDSAVSVLGQPDLNSSLPRPLSNHTMASPKGLALDGHNRLYVADASYSRVMIFDVSTINNDEPAIGLLGQIDHTGQLSFQQAGTNSEIVNDYGFDSVYGTAIDIKNHRLFVVDTFDNRVLVFNLDINNNLIDYHADNVLGQNNFYSSGFNQGGVMTAKTLSQPMGVAYNGKNNQLIVVDGYNNRVLIYDVSTITDGEAAIAVLGNDSFTGTNKPGIRNNTFNGPVAATIDIKRQLLYISEWGNSRVMIFDIHQVTNGEPAIAVLGQTDFNNGLPNQGMATPNATTLWSPTALTLDKNRNILYTADFVNNRVLAFDVNTINNGEPAIGVLGQTDFNSNVYSLVTSDNNMAIPDGVALDSESNILYVSDYRNRVLAFDVNTINNGEPAIGVLGQTDFTANNWSQHDTSAINMPHSLTFDQANKKLYISDPSFGRRIIVFNTSNLPF